ncbi:MAG: hypothetical protein V7720_01470 [Halioglobus sp.]
MNAPEYLRLFSGSGPIEVEVRFKDRSASISRGAMTPEEISNLVSDTSDGFHSMMEFDEHSHEVYKYEIDPIKNRLIIFARKQSSAT